MEDKKIQRINELARQSRERELTPEEKAEQKALREEYVAAFRSSLKAQLDATVVVGPDGSRTPLRQRKTQLPS